MDLGIVIVNWNVRDLLAACLDSVYADLAQSTGRLTAQVRVVDNGSTDGSVAMLQTRFPDTPLSVSENRGMGAGNNLGLRAMGFGPPADRSSPPAPAAALILNPDTLVRPGALLALAEFLRGRPRAGVVAPRLLNPDGTLQHSGFRFPGLVQLVLDLYPLPGRLSGLANSAFNGRYPASAYAAGRPFAVEHTLGAAFAVRAEAMAECDLFDEGFQMYCEEIDWQWRLARAGWERWVVPAAEIVHYGGQSTAQVRASSFRHLWLSRRKLYERYQSPAMLAVLSTLVRRAMARRLRQGPPADMQAALRDILAAWRFSQTPEGR
jgi:N-acetylglucosaminyl-diphospho-decaprenol L-rhamnosyltransferase